MAELIDRLKVRLEIAENDEDALLKEMIEDATSLFLSLRYSTTSPPVSETDGKPIVEKHYHNWILRCAAEMYSKMGAEGQVSHSENSIKRVWESGSISDSLRAEVVPLIGFANR